MTRYSLRYYANLLLHHNPPADLGDERICIELLRDYKVPEDVITEFLELIIETARSL